jgi:hypothetical protein
MKITQFGERGVEIELSRRNLETLLWALANHPGDATLSRHDQSEGLTLRIRAVEDDVHYADRPAGPMPFDGPIQPPTRELLAAFNEAIDKMEA